MNLLVLQSNNYGEIDDELWYSDNNAMDTHKLLAFSFCTDHIDHVLW